MVNTGGGGILAVIITLCGLKSYNMYRNIHQKLDVIINSENGKNKPSNIIQLEWMGQSFSIDPEQDGTLQIQQLTAEFPMVLTFSSNYGYDIYVDDELVKENSIEKSIEPFTHWQKPITLRFINRNSGHSATYTVPVYPNDLPDIIVTQNMKKANTGAYYFVAGNFLVKMNTYGKIIYFRRENKTTPALRDFRRVETPNGNVRYLFMKAYDGYNRDAGNSYYIVMDEKYNVIDMIEYLQPSSSVPESTGNEGHDIIYIDDGHYYQTAYVAKHVTNIPSSVPHDLNMGSRVYAAILQEVKDGKIIWEWDSTNYPELYGYSTDSNDYFNTSLDVSDYMHFNSIDIDPKDGNIICSFRHQDAIIKINKDTGEILWILGGPGDQFNLTEEQRFYHQHHARFTPEGTITLYNNNNGHGYSYPMEFRLDEENKKVLECHIFKAEQQARTWMGSAQKLDSDGTFLIGWGGRSGTSSNLLFSEIDFSDSSVLFEAACATDNYRVYKYEN